jgi:hypothetical protein
MSHYSSATPKRHFAYSNSPWIRQLDKGTLQWKRGKGPATAVTYQSKSGKKCYKGTKHLKKTELLDSYILGGDFLSNFPNWGPPF